MNKRKANTIILINALIYPLFLLFFYAKLPETIPMQFSMSGKVNWSLPLNPALIVFAAIFCLYFGFILIKHKDATLYPMKDWLLALILPELFVTVLVIALTTK